MATRFDSGDDFKNVIRITQKQQKEFQKEFTVNRENYTIYKTGKTI